MRAILRADARVVAAAVGGISTPPIPQVTTPATQLPTVTVQRISGGETLTQDGPGGASARIQVDCWALVYRDARTVARLAQAALNGFPREGQVGWIAGEAIQLVMLIDGSAASDYDPELKLHRARADYRVEAAAEAAA